MDHMQQHDEVIDRIAQDVSQYLSGRNDFIIEADLDNDDGSLRTVNVRRQNVIDYGTNQRPKEVIAHEDAHKARVMAARRALDLLVELRGTMHDIWGYFQDECEAMEELATAYAEEHGEDNMFGQS